MIKQANLLVVILSIALTSSLYAAQENHSRNINNNVVPPSSNIKDIKSIPEVDASTTTGSQNAASVLNAQSEHHPANVAAAPNCNCATTHAATPATHAAATAGTATTAKKSFKAPNLSDFSAKLNSTHTNAVKISNVDLFSVVSDADTGDIYTIYSIANLKPANAGCATIIDGEIIFIANKGFLGNAVLDYTVIDGEGNVSDTEQITVNVVKE